jgi:hypothetical protein
MKITQTIEIQIKDQTLILTKEEAEQLANMLSAALRPKPISLEEAIKEYDKKNDPPILPRNPRRPELPPNTFDPVTPYPWKSPIIWCQGSSSTPNFQ